MRDRGRTAPRARGRLGEQRDPGALGERRQDGAEPRVALRAAGDDAPRAGAAPARPRGRRRARGPARRSGRGRVTHGRPPARPPPPGSSAGSGPSSTSGSRSEKFRCTGPGPALERGPAGPAGELAQPADPLGRRRLVVDLEEPLGGAAVELDLVDRLAGAELAQLGRPVGGEDEQRHARLVRLDHRRRVVRRGRARRAGQGDRAPASPWRARARRTPPLRSSRCDVARRRASRASESTSGVEREPGRRARLAHAAADELVHERAQVQVRVDRCHRSRRTWPTWSSSTASPRRGGAGSRSPMRWRDGTDRSRRTCPATATSRSAGRPRSRPATRTCARCGRGPFTLAGYSMGGRIALHAALSLGARRRAARPDRREPGDRRPGRARRPRGRGRGARRPDRGDRGRGVRARVGRRSRCSPGCRAGWPSSPTRTGCATPRRASPPRCAGWARA